MENNTNKSQAEIYREERKERLAKAAAKNAKRSPKAAKAKKIAGKAVAIVLAVVLILGAVAGTLNFFGTPERLIKVSSGEKAYSFTLGELNWYYYNSWSGYQNQAYQFEMSYGEGFGAMALGYDYTKAPAAQEYLDTYASSTGIKPEELGVENPTWADAFKYAAVSQLIQIKYGVEKAREAGLELSEDEAKAIDEQIESYREAAKKQDFSLNRFLRAQIGNGINEKVLRQIMEESALASAYFEKLSGDIMNGITDEQIDAKFAENSDKYSVAGARFYEFTAAEAETKDGDSEEQKKAAQDAENKLAKEKAEAFLAGVTDEASFVKLAENALKAEDPDAEVEAEEVTKFYDYSFDSFNNKSEELSKWIFDDARAVGDKAVLKTGDSSYAVVLMTVLPHKDMGVNSHDVRHILVQFPTDESGQTKKLTDEQKAEYKTKAQAILDEYLKNPTEDNFAALATAKTEDPGSKENGGLYTGITKNSSYVEAFLNWAVDPARKTGDTGIVETEYGYHIMYYVKGEGRVWSENIKTEIHNETYSKTFEDVVERYVTPVKLDSFFMNYSLKKENKHIAQIIAQSR